jgi:diacylglycerol kinase family enzyme
MPAAIPVILNATAGKGYRSAEAAALEQLFRDAGTQARVTPARSGSEIRTLARRAAEEHPPVIVAAGGDGTMNCIASVLVGTDISLGVLPLGTLNHFARDLGIPLGLEEAVGIVAARRTVKVDVGEVNDRTFLNNSSIGIYPDIVIEREALRRQGYRKWTAFAVATARIVRNYRGLVVKITVDQATETARTPFLLVGNNEYQADGIHLGARSRLDGGRLSAYLAPRVHARELPKLLAWAFSGRARRNHIFESFLAPELRVETPKRRRLRVALDGEVVLMRTPLHFLARPLALRVIVP